MKAYKQPLVDTLFDSLHALCNLLLVKPENLQQVCNGEQLVIFLNKFVSLTNAGLLLQAGLDRSILLNFIQLRSDYKTQKLANSLKGLAS